MLISMKKNQIGLLILPVVLLSSGCSYLSDVVSVDAVSDSVAYRSSDSSIRALAIPPGLTDPGFDDTYALPVAGSEQQQVVDGGTAVVATGSAVAQSSPEARIRVQVADMRLKGGEPALAMSLPYADAWQALNGKLAAIGLKVEKQQPDEGIFTTVYQGNPQVERNLLQQVVSLIGNVTTAADEGDVLKRGKTYLILVAANDSSKSFIAVANASGKPANDAVATEILGRLKAEFERN